MYLRIGIRPLIHQSIMVDGDIHPDYTLRRYRKEILSAENLESYRQLVSFRERWYHLFGLSLLTMSFRAMHANGNDFLAEIVKI